MPIIPDTVSPHARRKRRMVIVTAAVLLVGGIVATAIHFLPVTPPDPKENKEAAVKFLAGKEFRRMNTQRQREYIRSLGGPRALFRNRDTLSESERRQAMENLRRIIAAEQAGKMRRFFAADKTEQNRMLDEEIARLKERRAEREKRAKQVEERRKQGGNEQQADVRPRRTPPSAQEKRQQEASSNPTTRAQQQVYRQLVRQRLAGNR